jgi:hypothetical protein
MAKTMRHAFGAALEIDEVAIPTSGRGEILRSTMKNLCKHQTTHQEPKGKTATRCTRFLLVSRLPVDASDLPIRSGGAMAQRDQRAMTTVRALRYSD